MSASKLNAFVHLEFRSQALSKAVSVNSLGSSWRPAISLRSANARAHSQPPMRAEKVRTSGPSLTWTARRSRASDDVQCSLFPPALTAELTAASPGSRHLSAASSRSRRATSQRPPRSQALVAVLQATTSDRRPCRRVLASRCCAHCQSPHREQALIAVLAEITSGSTASATMLSSKARACSQAKAPSQALIAALYVTVSGSRRS
mmetsp:Transcript_36578/g.113843  ORF Transcript_36578/g.113843 Transcript_36578/m.113843 type:complete len:205 (+) Transcript_36578:1014-1628(+)